MVVDVVSFPKGRNESCQNLRQVGLLYSTQFCGRTSWGLSDASYLSFLTTNLTRRLVARRLFIVPPCRKGTIHIQTSMSSLGFEPRPYGTAFSVANQHTGCATIFDGDSCK
ncbi:hypothetical protein TNCV_4137231 [Trichonephila clavipes]|nr:hypothetical protein TNCV_4137231 [Trichonephila clavipes]